VRLGSTARDGGADFTRAVVGTKVMRRHMGSVALSMRKDLQASWDELQRSGKTTVRLPESMLFRNLARGTMRLGWGEERKLGMSLVYGEGASEDAVATIAIDGWDPRTGLLAVPEPSSSTPRLSWSLPVQVTQGADQLGKELQDVLLFVPFEGELDWSAVRSN